MVFDWDDHHPNNDAMPHMWRLKAENPAFKATLFTVPGLSTEGWLSDHPDWVELVPHGWLHPSPYECLHWSAQRTERYLDEPLVNACGTRGFKAPGWQISDATYRVLFERGWWVADQHLEDQRRPAGLPTYFYEDGHWHGHVQNVCGNGLQETWDTVVGLVRDADSFEFASEVVA